MIDPALLEEIAQAAEHLAQVCRKAAASSNQGLADSREREQLSTAMPKRLLDQKDLARLLACDVRTLRRWIHLEKVPAPIVIGGAKRWDPDVVDAWLARRASAVNRRRTRGGAA